MIVVDDEGAMQCATNVLQYLQRAAVAADVQVALVLVVVDALKHLKRVELHMLNYLRFVVAVAYQQQVVLVRTEPLDRILDHRLQVVAFVVFGSDVILAFSRVAFALHQTEEIAIDDDSCALRFCRVQVTFKQVAVALRVVPVQVADK